MTDPSLFTPQELPPQHCTLDDREYRAQVVERFRKVHLLVEYRTESGEWREVRRLQRRIDVARTLELGRWDGRRLVLEDGRVEGEAVHG